MEASVERCLTELQRETGALGCERAPCSFLDCLNPLLAATLDRNGGRTGLTSGVRTSAEDSFHSACGIAIARGVAVKLLERWRVQQL